MGLYKHITMLCYMYNAYLAHLLFKFLYSRPRYMSMLCLVNVNYSYILLLGMSHTKVSSFS